MYAKVVDLCFTVSYGCWFKHGGLFQDKYGETHLNQSDTFGEHPFAVLLQLGGELDAGEMRLDE